ncbi:MAG: DUF4913 domain-containing protein [Cellulomonas sp.]|nr:DUF4913 domain-containing protein [Cellulomonas sp.]
MYARSSTAWCPQWWKDAEGTYRLEALWRAWEHVRLDPATGSSVWLRDHADPHMAVLLSSDGPASSRSLRRRVCRDRVDLQSPAPRAATEVEGDLRNRRQVERCALRRPGRWLELVERNGDELCIGTRRADALLPVTGARHELHGDVACGAVGLQPHPQTSGRAPVLSNGVGDPGVAVRAQRIGQQHARAEPICHTAERRRDRVAAHVADICRLQRRIGGVAVEVVDQDAGDRRPGSE